MDLGHVAALSCDRLISQPIWQESRVGIYSRPVAVKTALPMQSQLQEWFVPAGMFYMVQIRHST